MQNQKLETGNTVACVRTARGTAAIGSIEICGPDAVTIIQKIFLPVGPNASFEEGQIVYGRFLEEGQVIDDGIVGAEGPDRLALHCHGNPLILEKILRLLQKQGTQIITLEEMLSQRTAAKTENTVETEARAESLKTVSLLGVQIIQNQATAGLAKTVKQWLENPKPDMIQKEADEILRRSEITNRIIHGVRIVIAGPPNSGKSTLLNQLAGQQQAIVSEIAGTTRDWVTAAGRIEPLYIEWIDTAGLDAELAGIDSLDQISQERTRKLLQTCDLILYVLDAAQPIPGALFNSPVNIPVLKVLNKCDLKVCIRAEDLPQPSLPAVLISAKTGQGIQALCEKILKILQIHQVDSQAAVVFTKRQKQIFTQILTISDQQIKELVKQLLHG